MFPIYDMIKDQVAIPLEEIDEDFVNSSCVEILAQIHYPKLNNDFI